VHQFGHLPTVISLSRTTGYIGSIWEYSGEKINGSTIQKVTEGRRKLHHWRLVNFSLHQTRLLSYWINFGEM